MRQDNINQGDLEGDGQPTQASLGQFPQDQSQHAPSQGAPTQQFIQPPQAPYPGAQGQYSQVQYQQQQPGQNYNQQGTNPQQQNPYQQQPAHNPYQQNPYQQNPYQQSAPGQYAQNPYSQQQQYPTGYGQTTSQPAPGFQSYNANEYLSYDQKASRLTSAILGGLVFILVVGGMIWGYRVTHPPAVPAPTAFTQFEVGDGAFSIAQPVGWTSDSGGSNGVESNATFRSGKAKVYADSDLGGSLNGDMLAAQNAQRQSIADQVGQHIVITPPVVTIHREGEAEMAANYAHYSEQPMQQFSCPLGGGWYSEFTGNAGMITGNVHGYRATVLTNERRVSVVTVCRQSDWPTLQPVFMHELQSLDRGKGTGGQ